MIGTFEERFWAKVAKTDGCWNWTASCYPTGYGQVRLRRADGTMTSGYAHRVSYEMHHGPIPAGMKVDHRCFNRHCVNPAHLRLATNKQNMEHRPGAQKNSSSGIRGVFWVERLGKWQASVQHNRQRFYLGLYPTAAEASAAAIAKRNELFTHNDVDRMVA